MYDWEITALSETSAVESLYKEQCVEKHLNLLSHMNRDVQGMCLQWNEWNLKDYVFFKQSDQIRFCISIFKMLGNIYEKYFIHSANI